MTSENYAKFKLQCPRMKVCWDEAKPIPYPPSQAAFTTATGLPGVCHLARPPTVGNAYGRQDRTGAWKVK